MKNLQLRQRPLEFSHSGLSDLGTRQTKPTKVGQPLQLLNPHVTDLGEGQPQNLKASHCFQVGEPNVSQSSARQIKILESVQTSQMCQTGPLDSPTKKAQASQVAQFFKVHKAGVGDPGVA